MTLKTLGMGIAKLATKVGKRAKSDAPFAAVVAGVEGGRHIVNKLLDKDPHEGTITGIVKNVRKIIKKKKDKK
jgi:hypothetical protein